MTRGTLAGLGFGLSVLLLGLPLAHVERVAQNEPTPAFIVYILALLPLPALVVAVHTLHPRFTLFLFPVAHLPALVLEPRLLGPLVYSGTVGIFAQALVWVAIGLWVFSSLRIQSVAPRNPEPVSWRREFTQGGVLLLYPLGILGAFVLAVLEAQAFSGHAQVGLLLGWLVSAWVGLRWIQGDLVRLHQDVEMKRRIFAELLVVRRFSPSIFWGFSGFAFALGSLLAVVYGVSS